MKNISLGLILLMTAFIQCFKVQSAPIRQPLSIADLSQRSDVIFLGRIAETTSTPPGPLSNWSGGGIEGILKVSEFATGGKYNFSSDFSIKGEAFSVETEVKIPSLYSIYTRGAFHVKKGQQVLVFLKKKDSEFHPTDELRPFIPLSYSANLQIKDTDTADEKVIKLLISQLDYQYKLIAIDYLKESRFTGLVGALAPYFNDKDLKFRDDVLDILMGHQQVAAIPAMLRLDAELKAKDKRFSPSSLDRLGAFSGVPEAEPFLLSLLFHSNRYFRINALFGLNQTKNSAAIPYFLLGLEDDAGQGLVWRSSSGLLDQLIFNQKNNAQYRDKKEFIAWWQDELSGKHTPKEEAEKTENEKPRITLRDGQVFEAKDVPLLNEALFQKSKFTRRIAAQALNKWADGSSVPYLIVALYDPDHEAGWNSYLALRRFARELPNISRTQFEAQREVHSKAATQLWRDYLDKADAELDRAFASPPPPKPINPPAPTK